jgi:hypothetical protein
MSERNMIGNNCNWPGTFYLGCHRLIGVTNLLIAAVLLGCVSVGLAAAGSEGPAVKAPNGPTKPNVEFWLETSLHRVFPGTLPGSTNLSLLAARNTKISFQACFRNNRPGALKVRCSISGVDDLKPRIRLIGLVPMPHLTPNTDPAELDGAGRLPGLVPDPLWPTSEAVIGLSESRSFWITLNVPSDVEAGARTLKVNFSILDGKHEVSIPVNLDIARLVVQPRKDFPVIHWWRGEATWDWYKTGRFDERWWKITHDQLKDMIEHGSDVISVPMLVARRETFKRPCQLLIVKEPEPGKYEFDWSIVKGFIDMSREIGFKKFEWSHLWIYWGAENPVRVYKEVDGNFVMLWPPEISGFSDTFMNFLHQFLPEFHTFLTKEGLLEDSYFHLSDEPSGGQHLKNYKRAREILHEQAPWMKVMDALSDIEYGRQHLTDIPIPMVSAAQPYIDEKIPHWVYYCCGPQGPWLNRFMDTPLAKIRMSGMLFYRLKAQGFLHWGFNYWHKMEQEQIGDPFNDASNASWPNIPYGDPFMIYPGPNGEPLDSIRWEVFSESLQDYAILQSASIPPEDPLLKDLRSYANFPKNEAWIDQTIKQILTRAPVKQTANK